jgi:hypothetical protein
LGASCGGRVARFHYAGGEGERRGGEDERTATHSGLCVVQRDATMAEMHEVDSYLRQRMKEAREAENRRMLKDDREFTMKHRPAFTGLPMKSSMLQLEEDEVTKYGACALTLAQRVHHSSGPALIELPRELLSWSN